MRRPVLLASLLALYLVAPGDLLHGPPLCAAGAVVLALVAAVPLLFRGTIVSGTHARRLAVGLVVLIAAKTVLAGTAPRSGWQSQKYATDRFQGPVETSTEFAAPGAAPIAERAGPLSIRWTGYINPPHAATRTIALTARGSATLLLDAAPLLWIGATREPASVTKEVIFTPGPHVLTLGYVKPVDTDPLIGLRGLDAGGGDVVVMPAPAETKARWARRAAIALDAGATLIGVAFAVLLSGARRRMTKSPAVTAAVPRERLVLSPRRKIAFAIVTLLLVFAFSVAALLAFDVYLHHRVQYSAGVNVWGYRGDPAGSKRAGETRVVVLGGSTAFGYGLPWNESWPYYLERKINARRPGQTPAVVVNLGIPTDSARTFVTTLDDYAYLDYDIVCFYEGYNDLGLADPAFRNLTNTDVSHYLAWRYQSPVFRWTGYFPIFPLVLNEKAMALRYGGNLNAAYGTEKVVFRPNLATRTTAAALETASEIGVRIEKQFARVKPALNDAKDESCGRWAEYCGAVAAAVQRTLSRGKRAVVITQPYLAAVHVEQQTAMAGMLARRFSPDPRLRYVNLGPLVNIHDTSLVYDGIHLVARGNEIVADALTPTLLDMVK